MSDRGILIPRLKDTSVFIIWIVGLLLAGGLLWFLTGSVRCNFLKDSINRIFIGSGEERRLEAPINPAKTKLPRASGPLSFQGYWFSIEREENRLLFFILISNGTFYPCAAIVNPLGKVEDIISLSSRGKRTLDSIPPGIIRLYVRRIEGNYE